MQIDDRNTWKTTRIYIPSRISHSDKDLCIIKVEQLGPDIDVATPRIPSSDQTPTDISPERWKVNPELQDKHRTMRSTNARDGLVSFRRWDSLLQVAGAIGAGSLISAAKGGVKGLTFQPAHATLSQRAQLRAFNCSRSSSSIS